MILDYIGFFYYWHIGRSGCRHVWAISEKFMCEAVRLKKYRQIYKEKTLFDKNLDGLGSVFVCFDSEMVLYSYVTITKIHFLRNKYKLG